MEKEVLAESPLHPSNLLGFLLKYPGSEPLRGAVVATIGHYPWVAEVHI